MSDPMRLQFPGLLREVLPSGNVRWRVRKAGDKSVRVLLQVGPDHPRFGEHYHAARVGLQLQPEPDMPSAIRGSVGWLVDLYLAAMKDMLARDQLHKATVHQRIQFLLWMASEVGEYAAAMPQTQLVLLRDKKAATPGAADNFVKAVRAMYAWGIERGHCKANPAVGIGKINRGTGAKAWTPDDLLKYRKRHPQGTMAHLALSLLMFTACRIGDVYRLGRGNEVQRQGDTWLDWVPEKRGSARVRIPILPPLAASIKAQTVIGPTYLLTKRGQPFASKNAFGRRFSKWMEQAELNDLSAHGIRKAAGELLAMNGASQYEVMSVHGHTNAKTSEVYTAGADRDRLADMAMQRLSGMDW